MDDPILPDEMTDHNTSRIGLIDGPFSLLFKVLLASYPIFVASILTWSVWVTKGLMALDAQAALGPRFTTTDASVMEARINANSDAKLAAATRGIADELQAIRIALAKLPTELPPRWWEDWVREHFADQDDRIRALEGKPPLPVTRSQSGKGGKP